jgi:hypothetical protein
MRHASSMADRPSAYIHEPLTVRGTRAGESHILGQRDIARQRDIADA